MKKVGVVFPGQGSQYVGMGKKLCDQFDGVKDLYARADDVLAFSISGLCFDGPEEELRRTFNTQPAILLESYAVWTLLASKTGLKPYLLAGHSLGEYTALLAAGAFTFDDALRLTRARGLFMEEACPTGVGGMAALLGPDLGLVEAACREVSRGDYVVAPANLNSPEQLVLSGDSNALKEVVEKLKGKGYKRAVFLNVSGPFHSPLMRPAAEKMREALAKASLGPLAVPVVSNVDAVANQDAGKVPDLLYRQMFSPVRWEACVRAMAAAGVEVFLEVGPQKVLTNLVKKILPDVPCHHVEEVEEIESVGGMIV